MLLNQMLKSALSSYTSKFLLLTLTLLVAQQAIAANKLADLPNGAYSLDKGHASIVWKVSHLGLSPYVARFTRFDMDLVLNTADMSKSRVSAEVDATSISTENKKFDKKLAGKGWFKAEQHPKILFNSTAYQALDEARGKLIGTIEMFGIEKPVEFDVTIGGVVEDHPFIKNSYGVGFTAVATIKRSDWGFKKIIPTVGDEVRIEIAAEFSKEKEQSN